MRACHAAVREGVTVARLRKPVGGKRRGRRVRAAAAALNGAAANARINLASLHDTGFSTGAEAEVLRLTRAMDAAVGEARQALGGTGYGRRAAGG